MRKNLLISVSVFAFAFLAQAQLFDGSFEKPVRGGLPADWWVYEKTGKANVKIDSTTQHSGKNSVLLQAQENAIFTVVGPKFPVAPGDEVRFKAWIRTDKLNPAAHVGHGGICFRNADGRAFGRQYVQPRQLSANTWALLTTNVVAPDEADRAEVHLTFNNAPGKVWFDDASVEIVNPISFSLAEPAKQWVGRQELLTRVVSRQSTVFTGTIRAVVGKVASETPVTIPPGATKKIGVPVTLRGVGLFPCKLSLLDAQGTVVREIESKIRTQAPLVLYPASPCYHAVGKGDGKTRVDAAILVEPEKREGLRFVVTLADASGKELQTAAVDASKDATAGVDLRVPVQAAGTFSVIARLVDNSRKELNKSETDVHVRPAQELVVTIGADGFLRVGGKPQFPVGMYSCGRYDEMGAAGFAGTHNYGITTGAAEDAINSNEAEVKRLLDQSMRAGMRMMVELPRKAIEKAEWQQIRRRIETFRYHPGLLCWGSEERVARGEAPLKNIEALYRIVKELDPDHPFVLGDTRDVIKNLQKDRRLFFPDQCMDVGIWWWYPIPLRGSTTDGDALLGQEKGGSLLNPPSWLTTTFSKKPLWIAIQSYQQPRADARFPTPAEYRAMAYLSIINGVKSIWFYTGSGQRDHLGKPAGLLNRPEEGRWDYVKKLVGELREISPAIMAPTSKYKVELSPADAPVEFSMRELDGTIYLFAASKSESEQKVQLTSEVFLGKQAQVLYETHSATIEGSTLSDAFAPFGVHVYKLTAP